MIHKNWRGYYNILMKLRFFMTVLMFVILIFTKPNWCIKKEQLKDNIQFRINFESELTIGAFYQSMISPEQCFKFYKQDSTTFIDYQRSMISLISPLQACLLTGICYSLLIFVQLAKALVSNNFGEYSKISTLTMCFVLDLFLFFMFKDKNSDYTSLYRVLFVSMYVYVISINTEKN